MNMLPGHTFLSMKQKRSFRKYSAQPGFIGGCSIGLPNPRNIRTIFSLKRFVFKTKKDKFASGKVRLFEKT